MLEPVVEGKATDHALFCKHAGELLERVTGKTLATSTVVPSLSRITRVFSIFSYPLQQETFIHYCSWTHPFISLFCQVYFKFGRPLGLETVLVSFYLIPPLKLPSKWSSVKINPPTLSLGIFFSASLIGSATFPAQKSRESSWEWGCDWNL